MHVSGVHLRRDGAVIDLVLFNDRTAFAPSVLRSGVQVGGFEVACEQIASGIADTGRVVHAITPLHRERYENGVTYTQNTPDVCNVLLTARACRVPYAIKAHQTFTTCVDDPRSAPHTFEHLKGRTVIVCLSEWQAELYTELGHRDVIVIPSMIADEYAELRSMPKVPGRFICVNAWNKGTYETLQIWSQLRGRMPDSELLVGSPYSHPPDAEEQCKRAGATWIGTLAPKAIAAQLASAEAVFRVCMAPETFGVADAIAELVGTRVHCWCVNGYGAARDVLLSEFVTSRVERFVQGVLAARGAPLAKPRGDYRVSTIIKEWERVLFG
jgi:hypothetical protein